MMVVRGIDLLSRNEPFKRSVISPNPIRTSGCKWPIGGLKRYLTKFRVNSAWLLWILSLDGLGAGTIYIVVLDSDLSLCIYLLSNRTSRNYPC